MRRAGTESGLLGFCRKLSRDVLQFADPLRQASGEKPFRAKNIYRRSLQIEALEVRSYLSGTSFAAQVDPIWFQEVAGGATGHAGAANWTAEGISASNAQLTVSIDGTSNTYDWIVQFDTQYVSNFTNIAQTAALLAGGGIQFEAICGLGIVGQVLVRSSGASIDTVEHWLAADEEVAAFEQDAVRQIESTPNDTSLNQLWGMSKIDAYSAWNLTTGGSGANRVVVAVIDTGADYTHPDLAANIWNNPNAGKDGFVGDFHGYDFANNDGNPMDDNGHGTHVAGTIGAVGNNGLGVAGVNWAVSIMPLKFMTATGSGYLSDAIRAINYTTMERTQYGVNVRVINASWGGGGFSAAMQSAIQAAGNAGILFVAAAGNDAANNDAVPHYPAGYNSTNVIAVAATDQNDRLASFSCYGATTVDLAAPGVSIYSTVPGNRYGSLSGTSMATPHVAGAAALAWAYNPTATVAQIRNALLQGVDHPSALSGKVASSGRLNVLHTLQLLQGSATALPTIGSLTVSANNVPGGAPVELNAAGVTSSAGSVTAVYFYRDSNGNGVYDTSDASLGSDSTVVGGVGSLSVNTANWTPGTYRFFARALGSNNKYSTTATTTLTLTAAALQSFTVSANNIAAGAAVQLLAQCPAAALSNVAGVNFYADSNNNGVLDAQDSRIGSAVNPVNGLVKLAVNTTGMASGTYRYFAQIVDKQNRLGAVSTTTLTVAPAKAQSGVPAATSIATGAKLAGKLDTAVKAAWYQFQAVAGVSYTIRTELVTLRDSVLHLYDSDGKTPLASNDDGDSGLASRIDWVAPKSGTYFFKVAGFSNALTGNFRVSLAANSTRSFSVKAAGVAAASVSTDVSAKFVPIVRHAAGVSVFQASALGDRFTTEPANYDRAPRNAARTFQAELPENVHEVSLLDRHPGLRSALGSMLFDGDLNAGEPMESMQVNLDALDALFAKLAEDGLAGK